MSSSQLGPLPPDSQPSCGNTRIKINPGEKSNDWKQAEYQADIHTAGRYRWTLTRGCNVLPGYRKLGI